MTSQPLVTVVSGYWTHHRLASSAERADRLSARDWWWAVEAVDDVLRLGGTRAAEMVVALAEAVADDEDALAYVGAGPIEDLLNHDGPPSPETVEAMDTAARQHPSVAFAVRCVWWSDDNDPALVARFRRFGPLP